MQTPLAQYDIAVVGAGHAGCEAALACARLGLRTVLFTMSLDGIANMPCNPSIGGTGKGHLVREIDALGGEMGKAADATTIQSRMLNRGKGPAVHSLRAQIDRVAYRLYMKQCLEETENLDIRQAEIVDLVTEGNAITGVVTATDSVFACRAAVLTTGTYLNARIFIGDSVIESGPDAHLPATGLTSALERLGIPMRRFKTGTPARVARRSIDFAKLDIQPGDEPVTPFSFMTDTPPANTALCHIAYTNEHTHRIIEQNVHRSAMYSGHIEGIGARYCPSIEDKIMRFRDKDRHQIFVEPMGHSTQEMYLQGLSTSLPEDVQLALYRSIKGLEHVEIMRPAYAIEYDCLDPLVLQSTLAHKTIEGLYCAGQLNGTSGYEEAGAQGLVAGLNAALWLKGEPPLVLDRASSYTGTLIDDLVVKGVADPYRMMTSRCEYRLLLRQDNASSRLTPLGRRVGLVDDARWQRHCETEQLLNAELARLRATTLPPSDALGDYLVSRETSPLKTGVRIAELLKRPSVTYDGLAPFDPARPALPLALRERVEVELKYEGYIRKQQEDVERMRGLEGRALPPDTDYHAIDGLRLEAREKLAKHRPHNIGQASRISGVTPADVTVLLIWLSTHKGER